MLDTKPFVTKGWKEFERVRCDLQNSQTEHGAKTESLQLADVLKLPEWNNWE